MASEPVEAEFAHPPALTREQEDEYRELAQEGPLSRSATIIHPFSQTLDDLKHAYTRQGYKVVEFEKGSGEDPREWSKGKKWCVKCPGISIVSDLFQVCDPYYGVFVHGGCSWKFYCDRRVSEVIYTRLHLG